MNLTRLTYRARQFWNTLAAAPAATSLEQARHFLTPAEMALFARLAPAEQAHAVRVLDSLLAAGEQNRDLLQAALLHDSGKIRYPLAAWQRVLIVLGQRVAPLLVQRWGQGEPRGWRAAFCAAVQHPAWGAELAANAGASPLTVWLIRHHQDGKTSQSAAPEPQSGELLRRLQAADDNN